MSELNIVKLENESNELNELVALMTNNNWEYHPDPKPSVEQIVKAYHKGWYQEDRETFWIEIDNRKIGLIIIHDIIDTIPSFDIRLDNSVRGRGVGTKVVNWITNYIFGLPDKKIRIEAYTRSDNIAMRKTFNKCGFVKEGYLRNAWENNDGSISDSICYAFIRSDWENKEITPIRLNDLPF
ncbi:GNAT family N-acetyltransferase [Ornithinibacillus scapharcae]|uniref:GNAT family N-acetyltransferase n=1 Tax=Ornithinibacillus scapharcae TaxID=1147159 RepID=UPI000225B814|nr:GNAT family protein [Ornithinibacillus scapharcae]